MLTLSANLIAAWRKQRPEVRYRLDIAIGIDGDLAPPYNNGSIVNWISFRDGKSIGSEHESIMSVSPVARAIDPVTRELASSQVTVNLALDPLVRQLVVAYGLAGFTARMWVGEASVAEADWAPYFYGRIEEALPDQGTLELLIKSKDALWAGEKTSLAVIGKHPMEIILDFLSVQNVHGFRSEEVSQSSLTPSNYPDISHWNLSRAATSNGYNKRDIAEGSINDILSGLVAMLPGHLRSGENGIVEFKEYDPTTIVDHWEEGVDILEGSFKISSLYGVFANRIVVKTHSGVGGSASEFAERYMIEDTDSQQRYARIVETEAGVTAVAEDLIRTLTLEGEWLSASAILQFAVTPSSPAVGLNLSVASGEIWSFCGVRWPNYADPAHGVPAQPADAKLSDTRTAYLKLTRPKDDGSGIESEVIEVDRSEPYGLNTICATEAAFDQADGTAWTQITKPVGCLFRVKTRGALGTTPMSFAAQVTEVVDITIAVAWARMLLPRLSNGLFTAQCRTSIAQYDKQIGDCITAGVAAFIAQGIDGLDPNTILEIVGKEIGKDSIRWELARAAQLTPPASTENHHLGHFLHESVESQLFESVQGQDIMNTVALSGFDYSEVGMVVTIGPGISSTGVGRTELKAPVSRTLDSNRTYYAIWDPLNGPSLVWGWNDEGAVTLQAGQMWLWQVVAGAGVITSHTDLRVSQAIPGDSLRVGTGPLSHIEQYTGILDNLTSVGATTAQRILDDIGDGATFKKLAGVSAGNQAQAASVADNAIGTVHVASGSNVSYANANANFAQRTRGA